MIESVKQLLGIVGLELARPQTMGELIPYLLEIFVAIGMLLAMFNLFKFLVSLVFGKPRM